ncbi:MAG: ABC transporter substrate-binding protein [Defluviitaleaceae bacterium]|nr:ABC transporter substrate-binding protein [Defluviitaleaceae bacterium]
MMKIWVVILVFVLTLAFAGCSRQASDGLSRLDDILLEITPVPVETMDEVPDFEPWDGQILTISLMSTNLNDRMFDFMQMYMEANPSVGIGSPIGAESETVYTFSGTLGDREAADTSQFVERLSTQLMAGNAGDIIFIWGREFDYRPYAAMGMFQDWFEVMRADESFAEADFYMNVFEAASYNGRLYRYPMTFAYEMVSVNDTIPGAAGMFRGHNAVTIADLLDIAIGAPAPLGDDLYLYRSFDVLSGVWRQLHRFIDIEREIVDFDTQDFIDFIDAARDFTNFDHPIGIQAGRRSFTETELNALSSRYYFIHYTAGPRHGVNYQFLLPFENELPFSGHLPIVNDEERLLVTFHDNLLLNSQASREAQALAWDFIRFMQDPENHETTAWGSTIIPFSVYRPLMHRYLEQQIPRFINLFAAEHGRQVSLSSNEAIWHVTQVLDGIQNMPMAERPFLDAQLTFIMNDMLERFNDDPLLDPEQAAADLQSQIMHELSGRE